MKRDQFIQYVHKPYLLDASSLDDLDVLLQEYPYFQTAQVLYLKNLHNEENIRFNNQLKLTAAYAKDRKKLYELLNTELPEIVAGKEDFGSENELRKEEKSEFSPDEKIELIDVHESKAEEHDLSSIERSDLLEIAESADKEEVDAGIDRPDMQKQMPVSTDKPEEKTNDDRYHKSPYVEMIESFLPIADIDLLEFDFVSDRIAEPRSGDLIPEREEKADKQPEPKNVIPDQELLSRFIHSDNQVKGLKDIPEPKRQQKTETPDDPNDLISRFISSEPRIKPPEKPVGRNVDVSETSSKDNEDFITETLAEIYIRQEYYLKAIQAYEKLSLKYPEKSIYFAGQIEKVKRIIKENNN